MDKQKIIRKTYEAIETKAAEGQGRTLQVTISTSNPDRSSDIMVPKGMESDRYLMNPVVAAFHRYDQPAIAKTIELKVKKDRIVAKLQFMPEGIYPLADILYEQYKSGFMSAWSIGFIPKEAVDLDPDRPFSGGHRFEKWELLEYSAVLVPDNPEALTILRSKGVSDEVIEQATHVESEVEVSKVEKEIAAAAEQTKELEEQAEESEGNELPEAAKKMLKDYEAQIAALEEQVKELSAPIATETEQILKAATALRDALKPADKEIGLALRTLKSLLSNAKTEGGDN